GRPTLPDPAAQIRPPPRPAAGPWAAPARREDFRAPRPGSGRERAYRAGPEWSTPAACERRLDPDRAPPAPGVRREHGVRRHGARIPTPRARPSGGARRKQATEATPDRSTVHRRRGTRAVAPPRPRPTGPAPPG